MKISIVIPVINEAREVQQAIDRAWKSSPDEVVVVDGGSADTTVELAMQANCLVVTSAPGRAVQMNRGAQAASGDVLVFLHADNWLAENSCEQIRLSLASEQIDFGGFRQLIDSRRRIYRWIESGNQLRVKWQGLVYGDQALFIRRNVFEQVGRFPEIELMEDFALSKRLCRLGKPVLLAGPTYVNPRRWERAGPIRQTISNWILSLAFRCGVSPTRLAKRYRRHDN